MAKMDKNAAKVFAVLFNPVVKRANLRLIEKAEHPLLQLAAAFAGNNFYQVDPFIHCFLDNPVQFSLDFITPIVNIVEVKL